MPIAPVRRYSFREVVPFYDLKPYRQLPFNLPPNRTFFAGQPMAENQSSFGTADAIAAALTVPTGLAATAYSSGGPLPTAGNLAAATYGYRLTALNAFGETLPATGVTATVTSGVNGRVVLTWNATPGAMAYNVYGRTAGSELLLATVVPPLGTSGSVPLQYIDNGGIAPGGALPVSNTATGTGPLSPPSDVVGTGTTTGGSLAAGTFTYRVTTVNAQGETLPSTEAAGVVASGTTGKVSLAWTAIPGATGYNVYGRTAGSEEFIANTATATYVDTGSVATPQGQMPTANTALGSSNLGTLLGFLRYDCFTDAAGNVYKGTGINPDQTSELAASIWVKGAFHTYDLAGLTQAILFTKSKGIVHGGYPPLAGVIEI